MSSRNDIFNKRLKPLNPENDISDGGQGVERMLEEIEPTPDDSPDPDQELAGAVLRLIVAEKKYLIETLLLIAENKNDRSKSICELAKSKKRKA